MTKAEKQANAAARRAAETISGLREHKILTALHGLRPTPGLDEAWDAVLAAHPELAAFDEAAIAGAEADQVITDVADRETRKYLRKASTAPAWAAIGLLALTGVLAAFHVIPFWGIIAGTGTGIAVFLGPILARTPATFQALPWLEHRTQPKWSVWCSGMEAAAAVHLASLPDPGVEPEILVTLVSGWADAGLDPQELAAHSRPRELANA